MLQILVVYKKDTREVIATFDMNTFVTEMNVLLTPGIGYLVSLKRDIFRTAPDGKIYVK